MQFRWATLIPAILLAQTAAADSTIEEICGNIQDIWSCSKTITVPSGNPSVKTCPQQFFKYDGCKTKTSVSYWCGWKKKCTKEFCVPGTTETSINVACGVNIPTKKVDVCSAVRGAMGNAGQQFITKTGAICNCLPKALQMYGKNLYKSVEDGKDLSAAVSSLIRDSIELQKCMADNGFHVQDNKAELLATGDLSPAGGWTVIQAAEIDLASYGELVAAIAPCAVGDCEPSLIKNFFTNYLTKSRELMADRLVSIFKGWVDIFANIETKVKNVGDAAADFVAHLKEVPGRLDEIQDKVCNDGSCADEITTTFLAKVSEAITAVQAFQNVREATVTIVDTVPKLVNVSRTAIEIAEAVPDIDELILLAFSGKLRKIEDILQTIKITTEFPSLIKKLQDAVSVIAEFVTLYGSDGGQNALALVESILSDTWQRYPTSFNTTTTTTTGTPTNSTKGNLRAAIPEIQSLLATEIHAPLLNLTTSITALQSALDTFPVKQGKFAFAAGVASYQRWSTVSMDLPCVRQTRMPYDVAGIKGAFDYPEFYSCAYGPKRVPWPNHHVPYVKFRAR